MSVIILASTLLLSNRANSVRCINKSFLNAGDDILTHRVWLRISMLSV